MRTARAEVGRAGGPGDVQQARGRVGQGGGLFGQAFFGEEGVETRGHDGRQQKRRKLPRPGHEFAQLLVMFADHPFRFGAGPVVERFLELTFDDPALFLDHQHFALAAHELQRVAPGERPDHADLVDVDAEPAAGGLVQSQKAQRLHEVEMPFSGGDDAVAGLADVIDVAIDRIGLGKSLYCLQLVMQACFDQRRGQIAQPDMKAAFGAGVIRLAELPIRREDDAGPRFHGFGDCLEPHPCAGKT